MLDIFLSLLAGSISVLSPCVLPLLPIIIASALQESKWGSFALVGGLILSFTGFGFFIATIGFSLGLTPSLLQKIAGVLITLFGLILLVPELFKRFSSLASNATSSLNTRIAAFQPKDLQGQFILGTLLGAVWTPCIGPTLGAAISLASRGESLTYAFFVMMAFSIGVAIPILLLSLGSQAALHRRKQKLASFSGKAKIIMGAVFLILGIMILTGLDKSLEAYLLTITPESWTDFIYRF